ncbi:MAG TPA: T9SS type A sorting domain-containing protein [Flavobacteriales bacterium]|nr:T9SS type A sorting domain-containing protein [Flavobacteriales bacterium]
MRASFHFLLGILTAMCGPSDLRAQVAFGGSPIGLSAGAALLGPVFVEEMPPVDREALLAEDAVREATGLKGPYRFGFNHAVDLGTGTNGEWTVLRNGDRVWRLGIYCPGAFSINFVFSEFIVPAGGKVFVYNDQGDRLGAFTAESSPGRTRMGVTQLPGDRITIEYQEPGSVRGEGRLRIDRVTHGYRDIFHMAKDLGESGACNINVICPEGDDWRDEIRSVAIITTGGSGFCTGTLMNTCAEDGTPYFLTANHCLDADVEDWVFRFNWDSPTCSPTENAPMDQTVSGCTLLANSEGTDMAFLLLNSTPPEEYEVYYSGWDHSTNPATSMTGIHHPSGDIKKISHSAGPAVTGVYNGAECWNVEVWSAGTTEPGSSGSGLWNQNHQIVGQLFGGAADCDNSVDDYYGRLDVSWPLLEQWLGSTCGDTLGGWEPDEVIPVVFDAAITSITNVAELQCDEDSISPNITLKNNGTVVLTDVTITYGVQGGPSYVEEWSGVLQAGQTVNISLPAIPLIPGENVLSVTSSAPNGGADQVVLNDTWTFTFTASLPSAIISLILTEDNFGSDITWTLASGTGTVLYEGGPYQDFNAGQVDSAAFCLTNGCYTFTINDEFGDGICCESGDGSYVIRDLSGTVHAESDGQYGAGRTDDLCLVGVSVPEGSTTRDLRIVPNPSTGAFLADLGAFGGPVSVTVSDAIGRTVLALGSVAPQDRTLIDLNGQPSGMYLLTVDHANGRDVQRIMVER